MNAPRRLLPMRAIPTAQPIPTRGWGMQKVFGERLSSQLKAFRAVMRVVESDEVPPPVEYDVAAFKIARNLFTHLASTNADNWFTYTRLLGNPSSEKCAYLANLLSVMRNAYRKQNRETMKTAAEAFSSDGGLECLNDFIQAVAGKRRVQDETGIAYVMFRPNSFSLDIGVTETSMRDFAQELDEYHQATHGVLGAWMVVDVEEARSNIEACLSRFVQEDGRYLMQLDKARKIVSQVLHDTQNVYDHSSVKRASQLPQAPAPMLRTA